MLTSETQARTTFVFLVLPPDCLLVGAVTATALGAGTENNVTAGFVACTRNGFDDRTRAIC